MHLESLKTAELWSPGMTLTKMENSISHWRIFCWILQKVRETHYGQEV